MVGTEASKSIALKIQNGFVARYLSGANILDIGYRGYLHEAVPIVPQAIGIDLQYPGYDGKTLPFADNTQDAVYSSHCLEHIDDYVGALREWHRVLRIGGFMIVSVPHQFLYEKKFARPSRWNADHKRFYTPSSLMEEVEEALAPNSYRLRHLIDNDVGFTYNLPPEVHSGGCYEIEMVLEKIAGPSWNIIPDFADVDIGPNADLIQWVGFGPLESGCRWTDGTLALMQFCLSKAQLKALQRNYEIVSITIDTSGKQRIRARLNSSPIYKKTQTGPGASLDIPTSSLHSGLNTLEFTLPDALWPARNSDPRRLGIAVRNIRLLRSARHKRTALRTMIRNVVARLFW